MKVRRVFLLIFFVVSALGTFAQMSDEQVVNLLQNARKQGMGQQEMLLMLNQKGVTRDQLLRIKANYSQIYSGQEAEEAVINRMRVKEDVKDGKRQGQKATEEMMWLDSLSIPQAQRTHEVKREQRVFGRDIFNNSLLTFEPNLNIATPENYILGPGDEVIIDIWGDAEQNLQQQISPDGTITDAKIGPVYLSGMTVKEANARLKNAFAEIYSTMKGEQPTTFIAMSLGQIRSIRVNIMGEVVMPGTYTLPSLASLFHALYSAGGVNDIGSLRTIQVNRAGRKLANVDIYDYLLQGKSSQDIRLEDGDVIVVSPYQNLISLRGKVKRPMVYELKNEETMGELLSYAGGFRGDAYKKALRVIRKSGREYQVYNVNEQDFGQFILTDGDEVTVDSVMNRFENKVEIKGAVYRDGLYALEEQMSTVKQLIEKAEGIREDAFLNRAVLYRERPDRSLEVEAMDIIGILGGRVSDVPLRKNDVLYIPSIFDLQEEYIINIHGEVGIPGTYKYASGMTIEDLIIQAGGLKESASTVKIDVARRIKNPKSASSEGILAENYTLTLKDGFVVDGNEHFELKPFDEVYVRRSPGYQAQQNVQVLGEVLFTGTYALSKKGQRLSDLVNQAGGLTPNAYIAGARLTRKLDNDERARVESLLKLTKQSGRDSIDKSRLDIGDSYYVGIDLVKAMKNPGSEYDIVLRENDVLQIPEYSGTVKISGAVMYPNTVVYEKNAKLKHYIGQGGGFADRAKKRKAFIVYMNGTVAKARTFGKPKVAPGCEIIVPVKPPRKGVGLAEIMGIATSTTSMAALVTSIINSTK